MGLAAEAGQLHTLQQPQEQRDALDVDVLSVQFWINSQSGSQIKRRVLQLTSGTTRAAREDGGVETDGEAATRTVRMGGWLATQLERAQRHATWTCIRVEI